MKIRAADIEDAGFCAELNAKTFGEDKAAMLAGFRKKFKDEDYTTLIAEDRNKPVGFCTSAKKKWNNTVYIEMLMLEERYRSKGLGTKLLNEVKKFSKRNKARRLFIDVGTDNTRAIEFYLKNGFEVSGFVRNFFGEGKNAFILSCRI